MGNVSKLKIMNYEISYKEMKRDADQEKFNI